MPCAAVRRSNVLRWKSVSIELPSPTLGRLQQRGHATPAIDMRQLAPLAKARQRRRERRAAAAGFADRSRGFRGRLPRGCRPATAAAAAKPLAAAALPPAPASAPVAVADAKGAAPPPPADVVEADGDTLVLSEHHGEAKTAGAAAELI